MVGSSTNGEEREVLKAIKQAANSIQKFFAPIAKIKPGPNAFADLAKAVQRLPDAKTIANATDELRSIAQRAVKEQQSRRRASFGKWENEFIKRLKSDGVAVRELGSSWRAGTLQIEVRPESAQARSLYNHEQLVTWQGIGSFKDLYGLWSRSIEKLEKAEMPIDKLAGVFWSAYRYVRARRKSDGRARYDTVPIKDFFREVRVATVREELTSGLLGKRVKTAEFPVWALLYNMDRYVKELGQVPKDRRLVLQTGSQAEQRRGLGLTVNGLDARADYQVYCFVRAATADK